MARFAGIPIEQPDPVADAATPARPRFAGTPITVDDQGEERGIFRGFVDDRVTAVKEDFEEVAQFGRTAKGAFDAGTAGLARGFTETYSDLLTMSRYHPKNYATPEQIAEIAADGFDPNTRYAYDDYLTPEQFAKRDADIAGDTEIQHLRETGRLLGEDVERARPKIDDPWSALGITATAIEAGTRMAPGVALSILAGNPAPALAVIGADVYGSEVARGREEMGLPESVARTRATLMSLAEGVTELVPVGRMLGHGTAGMADRIWKSAVAEGTQEALVEVLNIGLDEGLYTPDASVDKALRTLASPEGLERIAYSATIGGVVGGTLAIPGPIRKEQPRPPLTGTVLSDVIRAGERVRAAPTLQAATETAHAEIDAALGSPGGVVLEGDQLRIGDQAPQPLLGAVPGITDAETTAEVGGVRRPDLEAQIQQAATQPQAGVVEPLVAPEPLPFVTVSRDEPDQEEQAPPLIGEVPGITDELQGLVSDEPTEADIEAVDEAIAETAPEATAEPHRFGSTQVRLDDTAAHRIKRSALMQIDEEDIHPEEGLEDEPHITVKYGLTDDDPSAAVQAVLADYGPVTATVGGIEIFQPEGKDYDVVVQRVESPQLAELNKRITDAVPNETTHPDYKPHITLGYVMRGTGEKYLGIKTGLEGQSLTFDTVELTDKAEGVTPMKLAGGAPKPKSPAQAAPLQKGDDRAPAKAANRWLTTEGVSNNAGFKIVDTRPASAEEPLRPEGATIRTDISDGTSGVRGYGTDTASAALDAMRKMGFKQNEDGDFTPIVPPAPKRGEPGFTISKDGGKIEFTQQSVVYPPDDPQRRAQSVRDRVNKVANAGKNLGQIFEIDGTLITAPPGMMLETARTWAWNAYQELVQAKDPRFAKVVERGKRLGWEPQGPPVLDKAARLAAKRAPTVEAIHAAADAKGIPWDNDRAFMDLTERVTGERHLDKLNGKQRRAVMAEIEARGVGVETYVSPRQRALTPAETEIRETAIALGEGDAAAIDRAAERMAERVKPGVTLVPIPNSKGDPAANRALADAIAARVGVEVADVLRRTQPVESSRERRQRGEKGLTAAEHGIVLRGPIPEGEVLLVDNVLTTGATGEAARQALGGKGSVLAYAKADEVLDQPAGQRLPEPTIERADIDFGESDTARVAKLARGPEVKERFAQTMIDTPFTELEARYNALPQTRGGQILSVDDARELSDDYLADRTLSAATHEPASTFIRKLFEKRLATPPGENQLPVIGFMAGGTGAGKTVGLDLDPESVRYQAMMDSNMATLGSAVRRIEQVLDSGKKAAVTYVYRDPVEAFVDGMLKRAVRQEREFGSGRTVPIEVHADTHAGANRTIRALQERYANNPRVKIRLVMNTAGKGNARVADSLDELPAVAYDDVVQRATEAARTEYENGRISQAIFDSLGTSPRPRLEDDAGRGAGVRGGSGQDGPGDRGRDQPARTGRGQRAPTETEGVAPEAPDENGNDLADAARVPSGPALEGVSAEAARSPEESGDAAGGVAGSRSDDASGNGRAGGAGLRAPPGPGDRVPEVPVPARGEPESGSLAGGELSARRDEPGEGGVQPGAEPDVRGRPDTPAVTRASDYVITDADEIGKGGAKTKFRQNVDAIRLLKELGTAHATPEQQAVLVKYVGWGGMPQAFDAKNDKWASEYAELKELLSTEEYTRARASTLNAHYTSPTVVRGIYAALERMGFKGRGRILEPSAGIGHFIGLMPEAMRAGSKFTAVELDPITGEIAAKLYPSAAVKVSGFQRVDMPSDYFDVVIGNPPFGSESLYDARHKDLAKFSIHNFFFAKSLDKLRPGGILAMVVSNSMLDKAGGKERAYLAARADFIGAIRLPNTAFKANAGTEVTTDIVFLQKRAEGAPKSGANWRLQRSIEYQGEQIPLNEYFVAHPEMMLGEMTLEGTMYRDRTPALIPRPGQDLAADLDAAIAKLPENIYTRSVKGQEETAESVPVPPGTKLYSYFVTDSAQAIAQRMPDAFGQPHAVIAHVGKTRVDRYKALIGLRDTLNNLMAMELSNTATDKQIEAQRARLNKTYDAFLKKMGPLHSAGNKQAMREDPDFPRMLSLEHNYQPAISKETAKRRGIAPREATFRKADIFTKRVLSPRLPVTRTDNAKDALFVSLNESATVDIARIAELSGKDEASVLAELKGLIFRDGGGWVTAEEYLTGNVKKKLAEARRAAQTNPDLAENVAALEAVQPPDKEALDIKVGLGASWIPDDVVTDFIKHLLGTQRVFVTHQGGVWYADIKGAQSLKNTETWGTLQMPGHKLIPLVLSNKPIAVTEKDPDGKTYTDKEATIAANQKADEIRRAFNDESTGEGWLWSDAERRTRLTRIYNDTYNTHRVREHYDGSYLTLPGLRADKNPHPHVRNAVARALQEGRMLADHAVGAGKTWVGSIMMMELRRLGLAKKPMVVVPNHLVGQWGREIQELYPNAKVLITTKRDFQTENRKVLMSRIATGDWDAVVVAHSQFGMLPLPPDEEAAFIREQLAEQQEAIRVLGQSDEAGARRTVKQIERAMEAHQGRLERILDRKVDDTVNFAELGVDALLIDEAHEYKNLSFTTQMNRVAGMGASSGSKKATDMFIKIRSVQKANGGKNTFLLTGTPISNSMVEMFTVQRYMQYDELREKGLHHFDAWASVFGNMTTDWELDATGVNYKMRTRFRSFRNMNELQTMYRSFADVLLLQDLKRITTAAGKTWPVPKIKGGAVNQRVVERSPQQAAFMETIIHRMQNMPSDPRIDNHLAATNDARKMALDMRLVDPAAADTDYSKSSVTADITHDLYTRWADDKGVVLIFIDLSTPKDFKGAEAKRIQDLLKRADQGDEEANDALSKLTMDEVMAANSTFDVYNDIKAKLIAKGIPAEEIRFAHEGTTEDKLAKIHEDTRQGKIRVLMGSTQKMGTGMNVQDRLVGLINVDAPWRPADIEQRIGRIVRQGNKLYERDPDGFEIEVYNLATKQTYDARMWEILQQKAEVIEQVRSGTSGDVVEDITSGAATFSEMKAAATGNPLIQEQVKLAQRIREMEIAKANHTRAQHRFQDTVRAGESLEARTESRMKDVAKQQRLVDEAKAHPWEVVMGAERYALTEIDPKAPPAERKAAGSANSKARSDAGDLLMREAMKVAIGVSEGGGFRYRGLNATFKKGWSGSGLIVEIAAPMGFQTYYLADEQISGPGLLTRIDNWLDDSPTRLKEEIDAAAAREQEGVDEARSQLAKPFGKDAELTAARERFDFVMAELQRMQDPRYVPLADRKEGETYDDEGHLVDPNAPVPPKPNSATSGSTSGLGPVTTPRRPSMVARPIGQEGKPNTGMTAAAVEAVVAPLMAGVRGVGVRVEVVPFDQAPADIQGLETDAARFNWPEGMWINAAMSGTTLYVFPERNSSPRQVQVAVAHELVGHIGVEALLGGQGGPAWIELRDQFEAMPRDAHYRSIATEIQSRFGELGRDDMMAEFFAVAAERRVKAGPVGRLMLKLRELLQRALRALGFDRPFSTADIQAILTQSERLLRGDIAPGAVNLARASVTPPPLRRSPPAPAGTAPPPQFSNPQTEERYREARKGVGDQRSMIERVGAFIEHTWHGFSRHHISLPRTAEFALAGEALRQFEAAPQAAKEEAMRRLRHITADLSQEEYDLLTRKIILDDLAHEVTLGHDLPFGFTDSELVADKARVDAAVAANPTLQQRLLYRQAMQEQLRDDLIDAGILGADARDNPAYFRHQVLMYARLRQMADGAGNIKKPKPGYAKHRAGSLEDINANYLEAEFEYLHRAMIDLKMVETIEKIRDNYDERDNLRAQAKAQGIDDWRDLLPDGYKLWQPDKGNVFFTGTTVPEKLMDALIDALKNPNQLLPAGTIDAEVAQDLADAAKRALVMGGRKIEFAIPEELADTLDAMRPESDNSLFDHLLADPVRWWKQWVLINPRRVLRYNLNNLSGDLDAVIAGNPSALKRLPEAIRELWAVMRGAEPSDRYREAVERGVFDAGLTVQEIPDIALMDPFRHLLEKNDPARHPLNFAKDKLYGVWTVLRDYTRFRENWMRYAAYLDYADRLDAGESLDSIGYGASVPALVDEVTAEDRRDGAALLARDMVGDYGDVSHFGQGIRRKVIPFYSWMEVNTRRYTRLIKNAFSQGVGRGLAVGGRTAAVLGVRTTAYLTLRMVMVYALVQLWNNLMFGDEEDELSEADRVRLHINLGKSDDGQVRTLRFQGALSDFLQWFGFEDAVSSLMAIEKGRASYGDVIEAVAKGAPNKIASGISPVIKTPVELLTGLQFFPDAFNPRAIRDKPRAVAQLVSMEHEYDWIMDKPSRGYLRSLQNTVFYTSDAGESAYNKIRGLAYDWNSRTRGTEGFSNIETPRSRAIYEWRQALRFGDADAAAEARATMKELGVTGRDLLAIRARAHPLGPLAKKDRAKFRASLSPREVAALDAAQAWYREVYFPPAQARQ